MNSGRRIPFGLWIMSNVIRLDWTNPPAVSIHASRRVGLPLFPTKWECQRMLSRYFFIWAGVGLFLVSMTVWTIRNRTFRDREVDHWRNLAEFRVALGSPNPQLLYTAPFPATGSQPPHHTPPSA